MDYTTVKLLFFTADWCENCKPAKNGIGKLAKRFPGLVVEEVDVAAKPLVAGSCHVEGLPTVIVTRGCVEVERFTGSGCLNKVTKCLVGMV